MGKRAWGKGRSREDRRKITKIDVVLPKNISTKSSPLLPAREIPLDYPPVPNNTDNSLFGEDLILDQHQGQHSPQHAASPLGRGSQTNFHHHCLDSCKTGHDEPDFPSDSLPQSGQSLAQASVVRTRGTARAELLLKASHSTQLNLSEMRPLQPNTEEDTVVSNGKHYNHDIMHSPACLNSHARHSFSSPHRIHPQKASVRRTSHKQVTTGNRSICTAGLWLLDRDWK